MAIKRTETLFSEDEVVKGLRIAQHLTEYRIKMSYMNNPAQRRTLAEVIVNEFANMESELLGEDIFTLYQRYFPELIKFFRECERITLRNSKEEKSD